MNLISLLSIASLLSACVILASFALKPVLPTPDVINPEDLID